MFEDRLLSKLRSIQSIRSDPTAMSIITYIYQHQKSKISEIMRDLKLKDRKVIDQLEKQHIIEENPHPDNEDKAYFLALGGQFFMEELFDEDPELFKELQHNRFEF